MGWRQLRDKAQVTPLTARDKARSISRLDAVAQVAARLVLEESHHPVHKSVTAELVHAHEVDVLELRLGLLFVGLRGEGLRG